MTKIDSSDKNQYGKADNGSIFSFREVAIKRETSSQALIHLSSRGHSDQQGRSPAPEDWFGFLEIDQDADLPELAREIAINPRRVYYWFSEHGQQSFDDLVKRWAAIEAVQPIVNAQLN